VVGYVVVVVVVVVFLVVLDFVEVVDLVDFPVDDFVAVVVSVQHHSRYE